MTIVVTCRYAVRRLVTCSDARVSIFLSATWTQKATSDVGTNRQMADVQILHGSHASHQSPPHTRTNRGATGFLDDLATRTRPRFVVVTRCKSTACGGEPATPPMVAGERARRVDSIPQLPVTREGCRAAVDLIQLPPHAKRPQPCSIPWRRPERGRRRHPTALSQGGQVKLPPSPDRWADAQST